MTTDRELLELAAKAAGIRFDGHDEDAGCDIWFVPELSRYAEWNPLTDDGDALRLAVKLDIGTDSNLSRVWAFSCTRDICEEEEKGRDPAAATRRAIVRAAAAIGEKL